MLDIVLMVLLSARLRKAYGEAGQSAGGKIFLMLAYWITAELLIFYACGYLQLNLIITAVASMAAGVVVGVASYRQALEELKNGRDPGRGSGRQ